MRFVIQHRQELFSSKPISDTFGMEYGFSASGSSKLVCDGLELVECNARDFVLHYDLVRMKTIFSSHLSTEFITQ